MKSLYALALLSSFALPAAAMSPATADFITSRCALDVNSEPVRVADQDGTISTTFQGDAAQFSLDILASQGKVNGLKAFVVSRHFIKQLKANFAGTSIPKAYEAMYLTQEERRIVGRKILETP
jgi:uncharacterized protein with FMN-binding domain